MAGAGIDSAGLGPCGLGTPVSGSAKPTGSAGVRYINPATRDYQQDSVTGQLAQMPSVRQRVLLALMTTRTSASVQPKFGIQLPRKIDGRFLAQTEQSVRYALRHLTDTEKVIRLDPEHPFAVAREYARLIPGSELVSEEPGSSPLAWRGTQLSRAILAFLGRLGAEAP